MMRAIEQEVKYVARVVTFQEQKRCGGLRDEKESRVRLVEERQYKEGKPGVKPLEHYKKGYLARVD